VVSLEPDGRVVNRLIDVNKAIQGDASQNLLLKDQDAVIVRRSFGGELINGINVFTGPASTIANLFFIFRNLR
jgi:polysaccharide biosynthesis/export protein